jgi:hypothetical protein
MDEDIVDAEPGEAKSETTSSPDYEVGYRRPPKQSQFKKGKSGNPNGRPREKTNLLSVFEAMLGEADVKASNGTKVMTKREAMMRTLVNEAMQLNQKAFAKFLKLARRAGLLDRLNPIREALPRVKAVSMTPEQVLDCFPDLTLPPDHPLAATQKTRRQSGNRRDE